MLHLVRPSLVEQAPRLRKDFLHAKPFRHLAIDRFLVDEFCDSLARQFPPFDDKHAMNEMGAVGRKAVVPAVRRIGPAYQQFDRLVQSREFLTLIGNLTGIPDLLYDPDYFGGGTHENRSGQQLDIHIDFNYHPRTQTHRRLNLIVFLNPEWQQEWGGCLELHENPWGPLSEDFSVSVLPLLNRCVIFETTEHSWHGFPTIAIPPERPDISRRSVAVYFYTAQRPHAETAPRHSTVYAPQRVPDSVEPGHTLTESEAEQLQVLFRRRDDQIRFLYEREKEILGVLDSILQSPTYRAGRAITSPARLLRAALRRRG